MDKSQEQAQLSNPIGWTFLVIAVSLFIVAVILLISTTTAYPIFLSLLSLCLGLAGFAQFEPRAVPPPVPVGYQADLIESTLEDGRMLYVHFDITFSAVSEPPHARELIKSRLQRALNIYTQKFPELPPDPYKEIETIFAGAVEPLCEKLRLDSIAVTVVKVEVKKAQDPGKRAPIGIRLGGS